MGGLIVNRKTPPEVVREDITSNFTPAKVKRKKLNGRWHLQVPAVMMTEGVHEGSRGRGYYSADALAKSDFSWNHMPIVVYHPDKKGKPVSARRASVLNSSKIGLVLETRTKDKKQRFEAWIDEKLANEVDPRIVEAINNGEKVEVSTGISCRRVEKKGNWNGEEYDWVAADIVPDHLAVLPDQVGACSIEDGAGLLQFNSRFRKLSPAAKKSLRAAVANAVKLVGGTLVKNQMSFSEQTMAVSEALAAAYGEKGKYWRGYVVEVFPDYVIFCTDYSSGKYYKVGYTVSKAGKVSLSEDKSEVVRTTEYKAVSNSAETVTNKGVEMKLSVKKKMTKVVVANARLSKETVSKLSDDELRGLYRAVKTKPKGTPEPAVVNKTVVKKVAGKSMTREEMMSLLSPAERAVINRGIKAAERERKKNIAIIVKNGKCPFKEEKLKDPEKFSDELLAGMAAMVTANSQVDDDDSILTADFSGANGVANAGTEDDGEPLEEMPDVLNAVTSKQKSA